MNGEEDETIWVYLEERFGSKASFHFGIFVFCLLLWGFRLRDDLRDDLSSVRARTEFIPVIAVVANEVCNLAEGLVCDWVFDWHGPRRHGIP